MTSRSITRIIVLCLSSGLVACGGVSPEQFPLENEYLGGKADQVTQCMPICDAIGSRSEGWYDSCTGELIGWAHCAGCEAQCDAIGSRSEGWYAVGFERHCATAGQFSGNLIGWDNCATPDPKACEVDSDCVAVETSCCSCSMGGRTEAYHKDYADLFTPQDCLPGVMCLAVYNCFGAPACVDGQCQMVAEPEPEPEPKTCGPFLGGECAVGEVCNMNTCAIGGSGTCVPRPEACLEIIDPVCGCNGQTYSNDCERLGTGVALANKGECVITAQ